MVAFTVRLDDEKARKLDRLASRLDRSRSWVAAQAIDDYLAREEWQIAEIEAGLAEADRGDFASPEDIARVVGKYATPEREP
ncbi:CopG family ribbon-helix-helix protein [Pinisolibacter aquiterrae]|uniref:CopG family ribbon-helix-helix protein n=1 Tax=Pinisolibacter aquiterrae TaxID=2815579 RepID=UPI001C3C4691|nr:CopG family ribbon-helix-helix protein [Pinisolibacter aquiterrae]MBV5262595.1 CopG family ribbon-helix-helix protein [Pinisolibacter aquiterrae]MCC8237047.1 CopG family ribbon-helix-helix protein [Pinisolibacter aquiterrae]